MADTITVFKGDGIGPEITDCVLRILDAAGADLNYEVFNVGAAEYEVHGELIPKEGYASMEKTHVLLKSPITTPLGKGFRSLNVTLRKKYDLYANIRPAKTNSAVKTAFENVDIVISDNSKEITKQKTKEILNTDINFSQIYSNLKCNIEKFFQNIQTNNNEQNSTESTDNTEKNEETSINDIQNNDENIGGAIEDVDLQIGDTSEIEEIQKQNNEEINENIEQENNEVIELSQMEQDANFVKENISIIKPINGTISSRYGLRNPTTVTVPKNHTGIDLAETTGTKIVSATDGTVILNSSKGDYGNHLKIQNH